LIRFFQAMKRKNQVSKESDLTMDLNTILACINVRNVGKTKLILHQDRIYKVQVFANFSASQNSQNLMSF